VCEIAANKGNEITVSGVVAQENSTDSNAPVGFYAPHRPPFNGAF
jgi:hypothetical protein